MHHHADPRWQGEARGPQLGEPAPFPPQGGIDSMAVTRETPWGGVGVGALSGGRGADNAHRGHPEAKESGPHTGGQMWTSPDPLANGVPRGR